MSDAAKVETMDGARDETEDERGRVEGSTPRLVAVVGEPLNVCGTPNGEVMPMEGGVGCSVGGPGLLSPNTFHIPLVVETFRDVTEADAA